MMQNNRLNINYQPNKLLRFIRKIAWYLFVYLRPHHVAVVSTINGILAYDSKDKKTGRGLYVQRNFEYEFMHATIKYLKSVSILTDTESGTVLDVGGYIGMTSTAFMLDNLFSRAIAFEPNPNNYNLLRRNIKLNNLEDRVIAHNLALSDTDGELLFELSKDNYGDHRIRCSDDKAESMFDESSRKVITVLSKSLDNLISESVITNTDSIKLIWMDIQGHEGHFIKGAHNFLKTHRHVPIAMEFWPYAMNRTKINKDEFLAMVNGLFDTFYIYIDEKFVEIDIDALTKYYDKYATSDDAMSGSELILCNKH